MPFCAYFKYNSKTTGHLQVYYTPNDSPVSKDASFHVKSSKAAMTYKLWAMVRYIHHYLAILYTSTHNDTTQGTYDYTTNYVSF